MKTTRVICDNFGYNNDWKIDVVESVTKIFGPPGTQAGRRWFYRMQFLNEEWRRKGRHSELKILLYFRNTADAVFFSLKNSG